MKWTLTPRTPRTPESRRSQGDVHTLPRLDSKKRSEAVAEAARQRQDRSLAAPNEHGGPAGLEPTRYGDWEKAGRCIDF